MPEQGKVDKERVEEISSQGSGAKLERPDSTYPTCFHQNGFIAWEEATLHTNSLALRYAVSVFEGIRLYLQSDGSGVKPFCLEAHLQRLRNSMRLMRLPALSEIDIARIIYELIGRNKIVEDSYVRISVSPDNFGDIGAAARSCLTVTVTRMGRKRWLAEGHVMRVAISCWQRSAELAFPSAAKNISNYAGARVALLEARESGFDNVVLTNGEGFLSEGPTAALFIVRDGIVYSPPLYEGVLPSITRATVFKICPQLGIEAQERRISRADACLAEEAFFCGTGVEFAPIGAFDGYTLKPWSEWQITPKIVDAYFRLVRSEAT